MSFVINNYLDGLHWASSAHLERPAVDNQHNPKDHQQTGPRQVLPDAVGPDGLGNPGHPSWLAHSSQNIDSQRGYPDGGKPPALDNLPDDELVALTPAVLP